MNVNIELMIERDGCLEIWVHEKLDKPSAIEQDGLAWIVTNISYDQELKSTKLLLEQPSPRPNINESIILHY